MAVSVAADEPRDPPCHGDRVANKDGRLAAWRSG